jgi:hypothetical protein
MAHIEKSDLVNIGRGRTIDTRLMSSAAMHIWEYDHDSRDVSRKDGTVIVLSSAELVECNCPDACDRDHDRD